MSVAFRRESDEEHLEPRFELPIPPGPNLVTARGLQLIEERVRTLETALRNAADGEAAKAVARDLRYWRHRSANAEVREPGLSDAVAFGRTVRVRMGGRERTFRIVGHDEAGDGRRIAFTAPLARALMGAAEGDFVDFAGREAEIEILEVRSGDRAE